MSSGMVLWRIIFIPESITCRNVGQCGLSRTSCSQGKLGAAVRLWVVDIEEVGDVWRGGGITVGAVMGEAGGENASCGWVMDLSCDLSSAISTRSSAISRWRSKPALSVFV